MKKKPARKPVVSKIKENKNVDPSRHDVDYRFKTRDLKSAFDVRTTAEMIAFLESEKGKDCELEARVVHVNLKENQYGFKTLNKKSFREAYIKGDTKFKEASNYGDFSRGGIGGSFSNVVGQDFTPLLGGPFYKQMYYYNDWLKMHQDCFFAYHHDPYAKATVNIIVDFTLGKGYKIQFENTVAQAVWDAFEEANDFQEQFRAYVRELSAYGENMLWWLPDNERYIVYPQPKNATDIKNIPKAFIPRLRVIDPSNIVEIVTYPEDITRRLVYVWQTPTQYQIYSAKDEKTGQLVQGTKFIYQQIPANQMMHHTINAVSNEKRGRSDFFAALPYFKRLRDSVNYEIIAQQKNSAWAIDTTIEGDDQDIANYIADQQSLGTIPSAGSEFVHTAAVKREYLANQGGRSMNSNSFEWTLSMIAASTGIPVSYYGTHLSGGQTRASAIVATEPVAKRFEMRQETYRKILGDVAKRVLKHFSLESNFEIIFPEIITQDRSAKMKDIYMAEQAKWISTKRAAELAAQELNIKNYDYESEKAQMPLPSVVTPGMPMPLTTAGQANQKPSALTGEERKDIADNDGA